MTAPSAGIVLYRWRQGELQVLLLHMGGPYWSRKDAGAWTIPKGEYGPDEDALIAAQREFLEETGRSISGSFLSLAPIRQRNGKTVTAWAIEGDFEPSQLRSNLFSMEWPPRSSKMQQFPEVDRAAWFTVSEAREKMIAGQSALMDQLQSRLLSPWRLTGAIVDTGSPRHGASLMNPLTPTPPPAKATEPRPDKPDREVDRDLDQELDRELDGTFPASDPLPWSHEVK